MRRSIAFLVAVSLLTASTSAFAAPPCKDAKGRFIKCPAPAASAQRCVDSKTKKFAKCGAPGAVPMK
jgi:hypothetical protein